MDQDQTTDEILAVHQTRCSVVGLARPRGSPLLLLARNGVSVTLLESHPASNGTSAAIRSTRPLSN